MIDRWYSRLAALFGVCFFAFLLLYWVRLATLLVLLAVGGVAWYAASERIVAVKDRLARVLCQHELGALLIVMLIGFALRMCWLAFMSMSGFSTDFSDYSLLWQNAQDMANRCWPISKSWTTSIFYAATIKVFGVNLLMAYVCTAILQLLTAMLGYYCCRKALGIIPSFVFLLLVICSPNIIVLTTVTATENLFAAFLMLALLIAQSSRIALTWGKMAMLGIALWLATWSRGEGAVLWCAAFMMLVIMAVRGAVKPGKAVVCGSVLCCMFLIGAVGAVRVNDWRCGDHTVFCSNDNVIPRYMGSVVRTNGRFTVDIYGEFDAIYGSNSVSRAHLGNRQMREKWYAFLKRRTRENWQNMSTLTKVLHVFRKELIDWWGYGTMGLATISVVYEFIFAPFAVMLFCLAFVYFWRLRRTPDFLYDGGCFSMIIGGIICVLALSEAQPRYGYILHWICPFYVAMLVRSCQGRCCECNAH